jgi:hypothetical protein
VAYKQFSPIPAIAGGTGANTYATGDILHASAANVLSKLTVGTAGQKLTVVNGDVVYTTANTPAVTQNIGCKYDASLFEICAADGSALSATNPGFVTIHDTVQFGYTSTYAVTANQGFLDDTGASEIINNLFGVTTGVAAADNMPFYVYAVIDSAKTAIAFACCRIPNKTFCCAGGDIGMPSTPSADVQWSFFFFENVVAAAYSSMPCVCIGAFQMTKSAADDWTVLAPGSNSGGIGKFLETVRFTLSKGLFGAVAGTHTVNNGGTAPTFTNQTIYYSVMRNGMCNFGMECDSDAGADGAGAVIAMWVTPFIATFQTASFVGQLSPSYVFRNNNAMESSIADISNSGNYLTIYACYGTAVYTYLWSDFGNGNRKVAVNGLYQIATS